MTKLYLSKYFTDKKINLKCICNDLTTFNKILIEINENENDDEHKFSSITTKKSFNESNMHKRRKSLFEHLLKKKI